MNGSSTIESIRPKVYLCVVLLVALTMGACGPRGGKKASINLDGLQCITLSDNTKIDTIDFGKVRSGEILERNIAFENTSNKPLLIITTDTSCGCLELDYIKEPLASGKKTGAVMRFYSSGYNYFVPRAFYIVTSASMMPKKLVVTAEIL